MVRQLAVVALVAVVACAAAACSSNKPGTVSHALIPKKNPGLQPLNNVVATSSKFLTNTSKSVQSAFTHLGNTINPPKNTRKL